MIWIDRLGKQALFTGSGALRPGVQTLLEKGFAVIGADLFGQGEFTADGKPLAKARLNQASMPRPSENWGSYAATPSATTRRCFRNGCTIFFRWLLLRGSDRLARRDVDVVGLGGAGHWVAAARAIAGNAIDRAAIDTAGFRFANLTAIDDPDFLPGGAKYDDLPGMIALSAPHPLWLAGEDATSSALILAAYQSAGSVGSVTISQDKELGQESAVVQWLLRAM